MQVVQPHPGGALTLAEAACGELPARSSLRLATEYG